jgi:hypothetical protein
MTKPALDISGNTTYGKVMVLRWSDRLDYLARTLVSGAIFAVCFASIWPAQTLITALCAGVAAGAGWNFLVDIVRMMALKGHDDGGHQ